MGVSAAENQLMARRRATSSCNASQLPQFLVCYMYTVVVLRKLSWGSFVGHVDSAASKPRLCYCITSVSDRRLINGAIQTARWCNLSSLRRPRSPSAVSAALSVDVDAQATANSSRDLGSGSNGNVLFDLFFFPIVSFLDS